MRLSVIVCLLEESERCLPVVMIFLQQWKDLLDHLSNENSQQKAAGWSLHVVALESNLHASAIHSPSISLFSQSPLLIHSVLFHLYFPSFLVSMYLHVYFIRMHTPTVTPSLHLCLFFSLHLLYNVLINDGASYCPPAIVASSF